MKFIKTWRIEDSDGKMPGHFESLKEAYRVARQLAREKKQCILCESPVRPQLEKINKINHRYVSKKSTTCGSVKCIRDMKTLLSRICYEKIKMQNM